MILSSEFIVYNPNRDSLSYLKYDIARHIDAFEHYNYDKFYRGYDVKIYVYDGGFYIIQTNINDPKRIRQMIPHNRSSRKKGEFKIRKYVEVIFARQVIWQRFSLGIPEPFVLDFNDESLEYIQDIYFLSKI